MTFQFQNVLTTVYPSNLTTHNFSPHSCHMNFLLDLRLWQTVSHLGTLHLLFLLPGTLFFPTVISLAASWYSVSAEMSSPQRSDHPFYQNCSPSTQSCLPLLSTILLWSIFSMAPPTPQTCLIPISVHFLIPRFPPVENLKPCQPVSHIFFSSWNNAGYIGGVWQPAKLRTGFYIPFRSFDKCDSWLYASTWPRYGTQSLSQIPVLMLLWRYF